MSLRTRIAVTFLLLLSAVLAAAFGTVYVANQRNAQDEVERQLKVGTSVFMRLMDNNQRQLTQAAQAVAADYGFREAVAVRDTDTLASVLQNAGERIGAAVVVLTTLDGKVIASSGAHVDPRLHGIGSGGAARVMIDDERIYQVVTAVVRSPTPVALITMGFEFDAKAARGFADITGLGVTMGIQRGGDLKRLFSTAPAGATHDGEVASTEIKLAELGDAEVIALLSCSLTDARAPFAYLSKVLLAIAVVSLFASAVAAFWLARNITRPLLSLTEVVDRMRGGSYDVSKGVERRDELGVLAEGLRQMQTAVQSRDQSIRRLAYEDALTGLMNRAAFGASLGTALETRTGGPIGVVILNLHRFRRINEHLGYSVGDAVLVKMAERLAAVPSVNSAVARLAADQFAAFTRLRDTTLQAWGTSLLIALSDPVYVESQPIDISSTLGLALAQGEITADELMRCADLALEHARREKRAMALYDEALKPVARDQLSLLGELRRAIEVDELRLYFQPKIELATNRIAGAEVLLRWQHPVRGLLNPVDFIPFAEQTGFIRRLTRWTLDRAIAQGAAWQRAGTPLSLAINIGADDVGDSRLDTRVAGLLTRHQLSPALLTLELTESGFIEDPEHALRMLNALAALGVNLSIDDFGTGYSSLSHLARMPVHEVKIDRSFIQGLESNPEFATVVRSAIDMGHGLGLRVVAEGIETKTAAARLKQFGCDIAQGYLYAHPMPREALELWLEGKEHVPVIAAPPGFTVDDVDDTVSLATF